MHRNHSRRARWRALACNGLSLLCGLLLAGIVHATTIQYEAKSLGLNRWSYAYQLTGSFAAFAGVNLLYPAASYANLDLTVAPDASQWSLLVTQPDPLLGADGLLGISAITDLGANRLPFTVEFTWHGNGDPGDQPFEVFDANFTVVDSGDTVANAAQEVPEPASPLLLTAGLGLLSWRRRRS